MEKQILEIVKGKDEYKYVVEITTINSKFEPQVSVKVRSDGDVQAAGNLAHSTFNEIQNKLKAKEQVKI